MFDFIIKKKIKDLLKKSNRNRRFINMDKIVSCYVIFDSADSEAVDGFVKKLEQMNKRVKGCCYKRRNDYSKTSYQMIAPNIDTNRFGIPNSHVLQKVKEEKSDVLIDLTINENRTLEYIVAVMDNIPMKIGLKKNDIQLYDVSIFDLPDDCTSKCMELGNQIMYYLNTL